MTGHIEVFHLNPKDGWATTKHDEEGNQLDHAVCSYRKRDALAEAGAMGGGKLPIRVYSRDGALQRVLDPATTS